MATWLLNTFYRVSAGERAQWVHSNALSFPSDWEDWIIKDEFTFPETLRGKPWRSPSFFAADCMRDLQNSAEKQENFAFTFTSWTDHLL